MKVRNDHDNIWGKRLELERVLEDDEFVDAFFLCIMALEKTVKTKRRKKSNNEKSSSEDSVEEEESKDTDIVPGVSFWVLFDWPLWQPMKIESTSDSWRLIFTYRVAKR